MLLRIGLGILLGLAISVLLIGLAGQVLVGKLADLFTIDRSSLNYVTVADWSGRQIAATQNATLLLGEASDQTGHVWRYRAITDPAVLNSTDLRFGYYIGFFEQVTDAAPQGFCTVDHSPQGRMIALSVDGVEVKRRTSCRLSAMDLAEPRARALPVQHHRKDLPRGEHRAHLAALQADPDVRVTRHQSDYSAYDKVIRVDLPTLWAAPPQTSDDRIDTRLTDTLAEILDRNRVDIWVSERNRDGDGAVAQPSAGDLVSGGAGIRQLRDMDMMLPRVRILCAKPACDAVARVDFAALTAPMRDLSLLQRAYAAGAPSSTGAAVPILDDIAQEGVTMHPPEDVLYFVEWIDLP